MSCRYYEATARWESVQCNRMHYMFVQSNFHRDRQKNIDYEEFLVITVFI